MKPGPILAMAILLALALWLVWQPRERVLGLDLRDGARTVEVRIGQTRGLLEIVEHEDGPTMRIIPRRGDPSPILDEHAFRSAYGDTFYEQTVLEPGPPIFRLLNITSWTGAIWIIVGLGGQAAFFGRMLIQWVVSERERRSTVPELFWWLSLFGGASLFAYFVWREDVVGVLGQTTGVVIYARNLRLIHKQRRRDRPQHASNPDPSHDPTDPRPADQTEPSDGARPTTDEPPSPDPAPDRKR